MNNTNWKWRYFIVTGALIAAFGGRQIYAGQFSVSIGTEVLALSCVVFGLLSTKTAGREKNQTAAERGK